jgi:xylan 1,4-beta-xylosidase
VITRFWLSSLFSLALLAATPQSDRVEIRVDTTAVRAPMTPIWAWFGNDEPNYAYMPDGHYRVDQDHSNAYTVWKSGLTWNA